MRKDILKLDANETAFFKRELEHVKTKTYDTKYKNLKAFRLLPIETDVGNGAGYIIWQSYSKAGTAKIISDYANDFPRVDIYATENESRVRGIGDSYGYSIKEIRQSQRAGKSLDTRRANTARMAIEQKIDHVAWFGDSDFNLQGFFDYPGITEYTVPATGTGTTKTWSTKTPANIIIDLNGILDAISVPTNGVEMATDIILPREQYNLIKNTMMSDYSDKSILNFFKENNPEITVTIVDELNGAGASSVDRFMAYVRDVNNLGLQLVQPFEQFEADKKGMEYEIPCHAEVGGVIVYYPQSVAYGDGI